MWQRILWLVASILSVGQSSAAPATYSCIYASSSTQLFEEKFDQIVIDTEAKYVEMRIARTIGTSEPVSQRLDALSGVRRAQFAMASDGAAVSAGVVGLNIAKTFVLTSDGEATYAVTLPAGSVYVSWNCMK